MNGPTTRLSRRTKLLFSTGDLSTSIPLAILMFFQLYFLTDVAGLRPDWAGLAVGIPRIWDAVNDPLFGVLSDRIRTRWGRRRVLLLFGSVPLGLTFIFMWLVPSMGQAGLAFYYAIMFICFDTAFTVVHVGYNALTPELTSDYDERSSLNGYRMVFSIVGTLGAIILATVLGWYLEDTRTLFTILGVGLGLISMIPPLIVFRITTERPGEEADPETGALRQPLHMSTTFKLPGFGIKLFDALYMDSARPPYAYTRWCNPTLRALEDRLKALEGAQACMVAASGMAAVSALVFTILSSGDHLIASEVCYAGSVELFGEHLPRFGIQVSLVDTSDIEGVRAALKPDTRLLYVETPANPILRISDIAALSEIAHAAGIPVAVDSTWASPALQKPLSLGADFVVHSLTKFINGHGDALGGAVLGSAKDIKRIRKDMLVHLGGALSPFNAWLISRGLTTLPLRIERQSAGALRVAQFLESHPRVVRVFYPGLESHPHHQLAKKQMSDFGGMLTFQLKGGLGAAISLAEKIKLFQYATSLGHAHSLLFYYPTDLYIDAASYLDSEQKARIRQWTGDGVVRASIGLENPNDLIADLDQALSSRTLKGMVGPLAYGLMKRLSG